MARYKIMNTGQWYSMIHTFPPFVGATRELALRFADGQKTPVHGLTLPSVAQYELYGPLSYDTIHVLRHSDGGLTCMGLKGLELVHPEGMNVL